MTTQSHTHKEDEALQVVTDDDVTAALRVWYGVSCLTSGMEKSGRTQLRRVLESFAASRPVVAAPQAAVDAVNEDLVAVPRSLLGSACFAIDSKRGAPSTLTELRRYTTGDRSVKYAIASIPATGEGAQS